MVLEGLQRATALKPAKTVERPPVQTPPNIGPSGPLDEAQAKALFAHYGVPYAREIVATAEADAVAAARQLGGRVVLKIVSDKITHKSDVGGVRVNVTPDTMPEALKTMLRDVEAKAGIRPNRFLVQEMVPEGVELILRFKRDPLGGVILLGAGGTATEIFKDTAMRMQPAKGALTANEALELARRLKSWPLLDGYRGRPKADVRALLQAVVAFSAMAASPGERLVEAEINPILVLPEDGGARAVDGVVVTIAPSARN